MAFGRKYEISIGYPRKAKKDLVDTSLPNKTQEAEEKRLADEFTALPSQQAGIKFTDLQMEADITYYKEGKAGKNQPCVITLYNPSELSKKYLAKGNVVIVKAGYETDSSLSTVAVTQIVRVDVDNKDTDLVYKLYCVDAFLLKDTVYYSKSYEEGTPFSIILADALLAFKLYGIPSKNIVLVEEFKERTLKQGYKFEGRLPTVMTNICDRIGATWYTVFGELFVVPKKKEDTEDKVGNGVSVVLIKDENLKKSVEPQTKANDKDRSSANLDLTGLKLTTFLAPMAAQAEYVRLVDNEKYKGDYKISQVSFKLNYEGDAWDTVIECEA